MKPQMDHDRSSELLPALVKGELDAATRSDLEAHLAGCPDCTSERAALDSLYALTEPEALSDLERARLHRAVMAEAAAGEPAETVAPAPRVTRASRWGTGGLYPLLGAAALLVIIGVFVFSGMDGSSDDAGDAAGGGDIPIETHGGEDEPSTLDSVAAPADAPQATWAGNVGRISDSELKKLAERGFVGARASKFRNSATALAPAAGTEAVAGDTSEVEAAQEGEGIAEGGADNSAGAGSGTTFSGDLTQRAIFDLETQAPSKVGPQIESCVTKVIDGMPDEAAIPVYAATGTYKGDKVLVLGFLFQAEVEIGYDRYMVWAFPKDNCDIPVQYLFGEL